MGVPDEFGYVHHSGRFDNSPATLVTSSLNLIKEPKVAVIAFTEIATAARYNALSKALDKVGWSVVYLPKGNPDTAIGFDRGVFKHIYTTVKVLGNPKTAGHGGLRSSWAEIAVLLQFIDSGNTYIVTAAHTPSHIALAGQAASHRAGMKAWNKELNRLTWLWRPTGGRIMSMDLNMDVARKSVRQYLSRLVPTMHLIADSNYVDTHDSRTIDTVLIGRRLNPVRWYRGHYIKVVKTKDSDHNAVIVHLKRAR